jgi:hypothetical protein
VPTDGALDLPCPRASEIELDARLTPRHAAAVWLASAAAGWSIVVLLVMAVSALV